MKKMDSQTAGLAGSLFIFLFVMVVIAVAYYGLVALHVVPAPPPISFVGQTHSAATFVAALFLIVQASRG